MKKYDVVALGELLIDFTQNGKSGQGNPVFEANPGGAPCNVLAMLEKWGKKTAFIGKVGEDEFGHQLEAALKEQGIEVKGLCFDREVPTTLALVHTLPGGDRDFSFYRNPGADMMLRKEDLDEELLRETKIFHYGSLSLTSEPSREATYQAIRIARKHGALISYDPNLREPLWPSLEEAKNEISRGMAECDFMKISDNEILWFTGEEDFDQAVEKIFRDYPNIRFLCLSMGADGSRAYCGNLMGEAASYLQEATIETTGAGDTFTGTMLYHLLEYGIDGFDKKKLELALARANAAASIVTTKKGALRVMPEPEDVQRLMETR